MSEPIFEIIQGEHRYQIWEDGRVAGFPGGVKIINRIYSERSKDRAIIKQGADDANEYFRKHGRVR